MLATEVRGRVLVIVLDRPEARNAIDAETAAGIEAAIDRLEADDELWVGVLTHKGPVFCAGADLKVVASGGGRGIVTERGGFAGVCARKRTKPLIAALEGPAVAGGCEIVLACDVIVATDAVSFSIPEVKRGLVALGGGPFRLARAIGPKLANELVMTGDPLDATRAYTLGLVNRLVDRGKALDEALELAERINENAPIAVRESLALSAAAFDLDEDELWRATEAATRRNNVTEDFREGPRAFVEKRAPRWQGR
ncbi:MAG TPA: enoyl-CoA hydratase-related protein [Acidimicrobiales bacterium]